MTDHLSLLRLVAGKSPAAQALALAAMRAVQVASPMAAHRVARVASAALQDRAADWTADERAILADAAGIAPDGHEADESARVRLSTLADDWTAAGGSLAGFARDVLGRDPDNLSDWLGGRPMPRALADWVLRVAWIDVAAGVVVIRVTPKPLGTPGRKTSA